ncbi:MAG: immune inhibitor A [Anaerolineaceae bacterium]|nr:immune inhibitor A [Anaerolineaceae bacterium]
MKNERKWIIPGLIGLVFVCICVAAACATAGGLAFTLLGAARRESSPVTQPTGVITIGENDPVQGTITLGILKNDPIPQNDPIDLAERIKGIENVPATLEKAPPIFEIGDEESFWISNLDNNENFEVPASLRYRTDHLYFWVENGVEYSDQELERLCETFENKIYPTNHEFFGSEWTPGVDNDPHLYVLFTRGLGRSVGGYFSSSDEYHPEARKFSNAHEMFLINADTVSLGSDSIYGTMAHEFQHMIHWYQDRNEEVWISEGFSTLAQLLNGYRIGGSDSVFIGDPDLQLNTWPASNDTFPHYGAAFLFSAYFLDRFGEDALKAVVSQPKNGFEGIDAVLKERNAADPLSGKPITGDDVFADWVVTSYLNDPSSGDGRYAYQRYQSAPKAGDTEEIGQCSSDWLDRDVKQYGADYIKITCPGSYTLTFEGASQVGVVAENAYSGKYAFWSNRADESDMTLTRTFDFTQASGPLTLQYHTWYDLEKDYDYLYLVASDDGAHWEILKTPSGTDTDPSGNSYGWGYTGESGAWIEESVDLSHFAGKMVQLRFEYITDLAVNADGFLLDDVSIPEINYKEDFESGDGGWDGNGFVRIENVLPQQFYISIIRSGRSASVETVRMEAGQVANIPLVLDSDVRSVVLVVSGATRFTTQPALYRFRFEK